MNRKRIRIASLVLAVAGVMLLAGALALHDVTWPEAIVNAVAPIAAIDRSSTDAIPGPQATAADDDSALDAPLGDERPNLAAAARTLKDARKVESLCDHQTDGTGEE